MERIGSPAGSKFVCPWASVSRFKALRAGVFTVQSDLPSPPFLPFDDLPGCSPSAMHRFSSLLSTDSDAITGEPPVRDDAIEIVEDRGDGADKVAA